MGSVKSKEVEISLITSDQLKITLYQWLMCGDRLGEAP